MIKVLLASTFMMIISPSFSQVTKCKAYSFAHKEKNEYSGRWSEWSSWEDTEILIAIDSENDRIKIFSKVDQIYDIIEYKGTRTDADGDDIIEWICVNEDGLKCGVRLVKLNSKGGKSQIYIDFADFMFV
jgi:hypothetical protein